MDNKQKTVCVYHGGGCLDGFTSAWIVDKALRGCTDLTFIAGNYTEKLDTEKFIDADVYFVDFSVKAPEMREIAAAANQIVVLDHHASAERELQIVAEKTYNVQVIFDMERSGAMLTWDYFFPSTNIPGLVAHVQDRDLWKFELVDTKALTAYMFTLDMTFPVWDTLSEDVTSFRAKEYGNILLNAHNKNVSALIESCTREVILEGHRVNVTNAHWMYASDVGHQTIGDNLFSVSYFIGSDGLYRYSLRGNDRFDCSVLAESFGGGGHKNASGFSATGPMWTEIQDEL